MKSIATGESHLATFVRFRRQRFVEIDRARLALHRDAIHPAQQQWLAFGALGRWVAGSVGAGDIAWRSGTLDARDLSWHTGALSSGKQTWLAGDGIGRWDGRHWSPLKP